MIHLLASQKSRTNTIEMFINMNEEFVVLLGFFLLQSGTKGQYNFNYCLRDSHGRENIVKK